MMRAYRRSIRYQLYSLWFDANHFTIDAVPAICEGHHFSSYILVSVTDQDNELLEISILLVSAEVVLDF
jgi:hypothetical protein